MGIFAELKRRNVFRVAIAYGVLAWVLAQVADLAFDNFGAPDWVSKSVLFVLILGFPVAVFFAWAFELTPEGIKKERDVDRNASITPQTGRKLDYVIIAILVIAVGILLFDRFRGNDDAAQSSTTAEVTSTEFDRSIAVLPFENRSDRSEDEYFTEGIHDDLLTNMANIGSMRVISRTSVMEYKDTTKKIPEIARELGVANILEGGVQRAGNKVRINVQLIDAATDEHLWAQIYDRELTAENLFEIQSEVSNAIAGALHTTLSPDEAARLSAVPTESLEAYELYMRGRQEWMLRTADSTAEAVRLFTQATKLDPNYAQAWAGLGDAYRHQVPYGGLSGSEVFPKADAAIRKALELNDQLAEAHAAMGGLTRQRQPADYLESRAHLEKAIELNPSYSSAYNWLGLTYNGTGEYEKAIEIFEKGLEYDPLYVTLRGNIATNYAFLGQDDKAQQTWERIVDSNPESKMGFGGLASHYAFSEGRLDLAIPYQVRASQLDPNDPQTLAFTALMYLWLGDIEAGTYWTEKAEEIRSGNAMAQMALGYRALMLNEFDSVRQNSAAALQDDPVSIFYPLILEENVDAFIESGDGQQALDTIAAAVGITDGDFTVTINSNMYGFTIAVAKLYQADGRDDDSQELIQQFLTSSADRPILGFNGVGPSRAQAYALLEENDQAIEELDRAVTEGWAFAWQYYFDRATELDALRDDPRFQALRIRIAAKIAGQLQNAHKLEAAGEIEIPRAIPRSAAPPI